MKANWSPPHRSVDKSTLVLFKIHRDGSISDIKIKESSNDGIFDDAAMNTIHKLKKLSPFPPGADESNDVSFTFDYNTYDHVQALKRSLAKVVGPALVSNLLSI